MLINELFNSNSEPVIEGVLDNPGQEDSPVASAIIRRILLQRTDLLAKYGPERVGAAVDEVADFVGDTDEIGSSDVSGWVRHVEQMLGNMQEGVAEGPPKDPNAPKLVQDRKTGKWYDPNKEFEKKMTSPEVIAQMKRMAQKEGVAEGSKEKTPGVALSKAYKKDFDDKKPGHTKPDTALTGAYSKTGKPGGELKKKGVAEDNDPYKPEPYDEFASDTYGDDNPEDEPGVTEAIPYALSAANANAEYERTKTFVPRGYKGRVDTEVSGQEEYRLVMASLKKLAQEEGQHIEAGLSGTKMSIFSKTMGEQALSDFVDMALDNFDQGVAEGDIGQLEKDIAAAPVEPIANMEAQEKIGGRHDADDFDSMVSRLKKLAGSGPMKTVYDPNTRRYKNVPVAQQPTDKK
jgi:hypothetical protein